MSSPLNKLHVWLSASVSIFTVAVSLRAQSPNSVFIEDFTWPELKAAIVSGTGSVLVFSGGVEETGAYVVMGKHNYRARAYAERIARQLGHTLVAPIIPAAPTSPQLQLFPGTINVAPEIFAAYNAEIVRSMAAAGFKQIFILADHGGSQAALKELAPKLDAELSPRGVRVFFVTDNYDKSTAEIEALAKQRGLNGVGHGGLWDTAETWAADSTGVRPALFAASVGDDAEAMKLHGSAGDPTKATPELGRAFGTIRVENAVKQIRALLANEKPAAAGTTAK